ncbi:MAG TPA: DUF3307 domain-containing protein [Daejeonella sp.]|nr:DUF3307 domain-containing protein [Daejeonella sp.]
MITEEINILLRLIIAHFLTDFIFQPSSWIADRQAKKWRSGKLYIHVLITASVAYVLSGLWEVWWLPVFIFISHLFIDVWKSYRPAKMIYFLGDQLLHILMIVWIWIIIFSKWDETGAFLTEVYNSKNFLIILASYIFITWPMGVMVGLATERWRDEAGVNAEGLARAGMWIGFFERFLILTFILINQYTAVGLLIAAKSILRFNDKEGNTQKKTEYVLIGTLMSFSVSVLLGWIIDSILKII